MHPLNLGGGFPPLKFWGFGRNSTGPFLVLLTFADLFSSPVLLLRLLRAICFVRPRLLALAAPTNLRALPLRTQDDGKGGLGLRGVAFMTVLAVLTVLAVSVMTATPLKLNPPFPSS